MRVLYIALGLLFLALGTVGIVLPLLPTVPFYLLAAFFLGKGSRKLMPGSRVRASIKRM